MQPYLPRHLGPVCVIRSNRHGHAVGSISEVREIQNHRMRGDSDTDVRVMPAYRQRRIALRNVQRTAKPAHEPAISAHDRDQH